MKLTDKQRKKASDLHDRYLTESFAVQAQIEELQAKSSKASNPFDLLAPEDSPKNANEKKISEELEHQHLAD